MSGIEAFPSEALGSPVSPHYLVKGRMLRGGSEWRFSCKEPDEGRPLRYPNLAIIIMPLQCYFVHLHL